MVVRWTFTDDVLSQSYTVPINPNQGGTPNFVKTLTRRNTAGPNGDILTFEGRDQAETLNFSGIIVDEEHLDAFLTWFDKEYQIKITDDLSREYWVYINNFAITRSWMRRSKARHEFTMSCTILNWT